MCAMNIAKEKSKMDDQVLSLPAYMASKAISVTINQVLHLKLFYMEGGYISQGFVRR